MGPCLDILFPYFHLGKSIKRGECLYAAWANFDDNRAYCILGLWSHSFLLHHCTMWFFVRKHKAFRFIRDTINPTTAIAAKNMIYPKLLVNRIANGIVSFSWLPSVSCTGTRQQCMMKRTHKETWIRKRGFRQQGLPYVDGIISTYGRESVPRLA